MIFNNLFRNLALFCYRRGDRRTGNEFKTMIIKPDHPNPDLEYEAARDLEDEQREQEQAEKTSFE